MLTINYSAMLRIVFDNIIFSLQRTGGISVVWYEILKRFLSTEQKISFIEFTFIDNLQRALLLIPKTDSEISGINIEI